MENELTAEIRRVRGLLDCLESIASNVAAVGGAAIPAQPLEWAASMIEEAQARLCRIDEAFEAFEDQVSSALTVQLSIDNAPANAESGFAAALQVAAEAARTLCEIQRAEDVDACMAGVVEKVAAALELAAKCAKQLIRREPPDEPPARGLTN
jgi:hypothetical protein